MIHGFWLGSGNQVLRKNKPLLLAGPVLSLHVISQMRFVGRGFSRDIEWPENLGFSPEPLLAQKSPRVIEAATTLFGDSRRWEMFLRFSPAGPDKIQSVPEVT